jgi:hypothetical protein
MRTALSKSLVVAAAILALVVGLCPAQAASATTMPMPFSCSRTTFGEIHDGYVWWFKFRGQRFSGGTYYNTYDVGLTSYPVPVRYIGTVEKACGHSSYVTTG